MSGSVADNTSVVNDQQRHDTIRYHQTVPTDAIRYHQYHQYPQYQYHQSKALPPPQFPILQLGQHHHSHSHHLGNITAQTWHTSYLVPDSQCQCQVSSRNVEVRRSLQSVSWHLHQLQHPLPGLPHCQGGPPAGWQSWAGGRHYLIQLPPHTTVEAQWEPCLWCLDK